MIKGKCKGRGTALFLVLAVVFVVVALANIILSFMHSQSRLTHHQVSRIQAYYAAQAGMNYALEQLRTGNWKAGENYTSRQGSSYTYNSTLDSITSGFDPPSIN
ncbi:MAG: hypothetical protein NT033_04405, partial [Candidatus Omnitrophica bacterium]|nr:hypothetical protein [Candidatus Omnitrophota bacterium]